MEQHTPLDSFFSTATLRSLSERNRLEKQVRAVIYFADVRRIKRGYYHCDLKRITVSPEEYPDYELTDRYAALLEEMIRREPAYWLWTHNRWKRTKEEWERRQSEEKC